MIPLMPFFNDEMVDATWTAGAAGAYVSGEWVPAFAAPVTIKIIYPQPLTQLQLNQLPQGERVRNYVQTWTSADIDVRESTVDSDRVTYDGRTFLVYQIGDRTLSGAFKNVIMREATADE